MAKWSIVLAVVVLVGITSPAGAATRCLDVTIEPGKTYEFAVNEFGQTAPLSVAPKKNGVTFLMRKTYMEPKEVGATGQFDSCELAEAFAQSAKREVEAAMDAMGKLPFGSFFKNLGEGLRELGTGVSELKFKKDGFHGRSCAKLQDGSEDCIESNDPEEYERLVKERDQRLKNQNEKRIPDVLKQMRKEYTEKGDTEGLKYIEQMERIYRERHQQR